MWCCAHAPGHASRIALGVAVATGPYSSDDDLSGSDFGLGAAKAQYAWLDHAWWLQPELQFEFGSRGGLHLVVTGVGLAFLLNPDAVECKTRPANPEVTPGGCSMERVIGTFTIELGYAFR